MPSWRHLDVSCKHLEASGVSSCELGGCFLGHSNPNLDLIRNHNSKPDPNPNPKPNPTLNSNTNPNPNPTPNLPNPNPKP